MHFFSPNSCNKICLEYKDVCKEPEEAKNTNTGKKHESPHP